MITPPPTPARLTPRRSRDAGGGFLPRLLALIALLVLAAAALLAGPQPAHAQATDYDDDNDGLIDIRTLAQFNAMRWDRNGNGNPDAGQLTNFRNAFPGAYAGMGCPADACQGYELRASLTATATWTPISNYATTLEGNGHTISGINTGARPIRSGVFGILTGASVIRNLGIISPNVAVNGVSAAVGGLASEANGRIYSSYVAGGAVSASGDFSDADGLVGALGAGASIRTSYVSAAVTVIGSPSIPRAGGLVGRIGGGSIVASYSTGAVTGSGSFIRGLVGNPAGNPITNSYCDATTSGRSSDAQCRTTAQLQTPTGYTGIYANWNLSDLDDDPYDDYPWNFGTTTTYPTLNTPAQRLAAIPVIANPVDYDTNDNNLIDVSATPS